MQVCVILKCTKHPETGSRVYCVEDVCATKDIAKELIAKHKELEGKDNENVSFVIEGWDVKDNADELSPRKIVWEEE